MGGKHTISAFILSFSITLASAQVGSSGVYPFVNIPASARIAAMGGTFIHVKDDDLNSALQNPAALNPGMNNYLLFSGVSYGGGIAFGDVAYALKPIKDGKFGDFDIWMHYVNYGSFDETDVTGEILGTFKAADYALNLGWGYQLNRYFSAGANLKGIYSDYYIASSVGAALDVSAMFCDSLSGWNVTVLFRDVGTQFKSYVEDNTESLPAEALIAASKKFLHLPARLSLTYSHVEQFDITYVDKNSTDNYDALTGEFKPEEITFFDKFSSHLTPAVEILLSKNFHLRASYNFQRRRELAFDSRPGTAGLSFGFGLKISKFIISYGRSKMNVAGASNHFSLAANLNEFSKKN